MSAPAPHARRGTPTRGADAASARLLTAADARSTARGEKAASVRALVRQHAASARATRPSTADNAARPHVSNRRDQDDDRTAPGSRALEGGRGAPRWGGLAVRLVLAPIRLYQRAISPALPRRCKYHPTCSAYAVQAVQSYGILRGAVLAAWRLLRCNPFSHGGYDPVSAQTLFRRRPRSHSTSASHS